MKRLIQAVTLLVILSSCQKDLDLKYHDIEPLTVIEAELTPQGLKASITLTTPMDEPMDRTRLTDALVRLTDLTSGEEIEPLPDDDGYFISTSPGIAGHDYRLTVSRGEETYTAETRMYAPAEIIGLQFSWINMPYDQVAVLQGMFTDDSATEGDCFWLKLYRNGEIYMWNQLDDRSAADGVCTFFTMTTRKDTEAEDDNTVLYDGDVITLSVSGISRPMYNYLEALQNDSSGPVMFSGHKCLGYFMATSPVEATITFHPDQIPVFK